MSLTENALRQLALDLVEGRAFSSMQIRPEDIHLAPSVFMPLAFGDVRDLARSGVTDVYQYVDKAAAHGINGYPMFSSMHCIYKEESPRLLELIREAQAHRKEFVEAAL
jgi:hypothetical protein